MNCFVYGLLGKSLLFMARNSSKLITSSCWSTNLLKKDLIHNLFSLFIANHVRGCFSALFSLLSYSSFLASLWPWMPQAWVLGTQAIWSTNVFLGKTRLSLNGPFLKRKTVEFWGRRRFAYVKDLSRIKIHFILITILSTVMQTVIDHVQSKKWDHSVK